MTAMDVAQYTACAGWKHNYKGGRLSVQVEQQLPKVSLIAYKRLNASLQNLLLMTQNSPTAIHPELISVIANTCWGENYCQRRK